MGLYATIRGEEIKYGGLFAKEAAAAGVVAKNAAIQLSKTEVKCILTTIFCKLRAGLDLGAEYGTAFSFRNLATDAYRLALLHDWTVLSDCDTLTFV